MRKPKALDRLNPNRKPPRPRAKAVRLRKATSKLDWLREAARQAEEAYAEALASETSYVAARQFLTEAKKYRDEIEVLEKAEASGDRSEEAFLADLEEQLPTWPTPYLELAVSEYLRRHPGVRLVSPGAA